MAKKNTRVSALREELNQTRRAVSRKISRIQRNNDATVAGSEFDPRRPIAPNLNARQLEAQIAREKAFLSRKIQFVGDAHGAPIPRAEWVPLAKTQEKYNAMVVKGLDAMGSLVLPSGETVAKRNAKMKADHEMAGNPSVKTPHQPRVLTPKNVNGRKAVKALKEDLERKMRPSYDKKELKRQKEELRQVLAAIKNPGLDEDIASLTNNQFNLLWNYTSFANAATHWYEFVQDKLRGKKKSWHQSRLEAKYKEALNLVKWVKEQDI